MSHRWENRAMSAEEIARELGCTKSAIKNVIERAMRKLRDGRVNHLKPVMEVLESERGKRVRPEIKI